ncbi:hypothetical protein G7077_09635 [Sphingomonas piscis]|uniref:Tetratricopeptide repeat protein n=1 Tax=Sphingomonas piscis TaxID=2714943 RepID=A0A6G7YQU2_9SPHN|nr:tetratricopeptide repeat protein [Sphingomonas piscis]QIK79118.1 hypothetical protein G7077_09635 [Sphingomonas piscis]
MLLASCVALAALAGCQSRQDRAGEAYQRYQAAAAAGDLSGVRQALLRLVSADDTVAEYWAELGKVQLQLGDYSAAYEAFLHAHELDPANASILAILTQITLRSGNLEQAEQRARELEIVAPEDPAVRLTFGYVALRRGDIEEANRQADLLLASAPYESSAKVLRARILLRSGESQQAIDVLREQVRLQPSDEPSLRALLSIYEFRELWPDAAATASHLLRLQPADGQLRAQLIESELRAGRALVAAQVTIEGLKSANATQIEKLLYPWVALGTQREIARAVFKFGKAATGARREAFARFLIAANQPQWVIELTQDAATLPINPTNAVPNALYGLAMARIGQRAAGLDRLNQVIAMDSSNADAIRGRAELRSAAGDHRLAIEDVQRLITLERQSAQARLMLARIYLAAGLPNDTRRTLWDAFHEITADRTIYVALRNWLLRTEGNDAAIRLSKEFEDQRNQRMARSFA